MSDKEPPLTPWDAPIGNPKSTTINFGQMGNTVKIHSAPSEPPKPPTRWQRIKRSFHQPWHKSAFIYLPYFVLLGIEITAWFTTPGAKGGHTALAGSIGFIVGIIYMTFLNRQTKKFDDFMRDMDLDLMRIEERIKVHQEYEAKYGPL